MRDMQTPGAIFRVASLAAAVVAASNVSAADKEQLEEVLVWGTQVSASSINLKEDMLAIRQADHISDLLRTIPGVDVGGAHSLNQRITIRSMDDKDLRITIDGANQNTYMYHHMGNLQIHADILQSVDVEIGTNSVVNGGLGGAVRFETKTARQLLRDGQRFGARVQGSYSSNAGDGWSLTAYGMATDTLDFLVYHNAVNRDNYEVGGGVIKDAEGRTVAGTNGEVQGLEGEVQDTLIKLGWDIAANQRIELGYETYSDEGDYSYRPDMGLATDLAINAILGGPLLWPTEFDRDTITLNYEAKFDATTLKVALYDNQSTLARDESGWLSSTAVIRGFPISSEAAMVSGDADNRGANVLAETTLGAHTLTYGAEYIEYDTRYEAAYFTGVVQRSEEDASNFSLFVQDRIQLSDAFALIPGIRYDSSDMNTALTQETFDEITGALALEYAVNDALLLKASTTQLFKAPEVAEVFVGAGLRDTANPDIKAETGFNTELSLAYADAVLGADRFSFGLTAFQTDIDDYIYDYAARGFKDNIGDMQIEGLEAYVGYDIGALKMLLTYSNAESELDAFAEYARFDGARIDREQGDTISLSLDYSFESIDLHLHWNTLHVADVDAVAAELDGPSANNAKEGFVVHNISARWMPEQVPGLSVILGVDNLADEYYASQSSRTGQSFHPLFQDLYLLDYEPGRNVKMTVSYQF